MNLSPHQKPLMSDDRISTAKALFLALEPFVKESPTMSLQNFMTFLRVASAEGRGVTEYAEEARVYKTVMTRHLQDLGDRDRHGEAGLHPASPRPCGLAHQSRVDNAEGRRLPRQRSQSSKLAVSRIAHGTSLSLGGASPTKNLMIRWNNLLSHPTLTY
jgi:hypothetical protein